MAGELVGGGRGAGKGSLKPWTTIQIKDEVSAAPTLRGRGGVQEGRTTPLLATSLSWVKRKRHRRAKVKEPQEGDSGEVR